MYKQLIIDVKLNSDESETLINSIIKTITEQGHEVLTPNDLIDSNNVEEFYNIANIISQDLQNNGYEEASKHVDCKYDL